MENRALENLGVSEPARYKEYLIDVSEFFWISKHQWFLIKNFWKLNCLQIRYRVLVEEIII